RGAGVSALEHLAVRSTGAISRNRRAQSLGPETSGEIQKSDLSRLDGGGRDGAPATAGEPGLPEYKPEVGGRFSEAGLRVRLESARFLRQARQAHDAVRLLRTREMDRGCWGSAARRWLAGHDRGGRGSRGQGTRISRVARLEAGHQGHEGVAEGRSLPAHAGI